MFSIMHSVKLDRLILANRVPDGSNEVTNEDK